MKYTKSRDGFHRVTLLPRVRLERHEYLLYNDAAKKLGYKSLTDWLAMFLNSSAWQEILSEDLEPKGKDE